MPAGMLKAHFEFAPKVELWAANKASRLAPVSVSGESYEENGTLERIKLLETRSDSYERCKSGNREAQKREQETLWNQN